MKSSYLRLSNVNHINRNTVVTWQKEKRNIRVKVHVITNKLHVTLEQGIVELV